MVNAARLGDGLLLTCFAGLEGGLRSRLMRVVLLLLLLLIGLLWRRGVFCGCLGCGTSGRSTRWLGRVLVVEIMDEEDMVTHSSSSVSKSE